MLRRIRENNSVPVVMLTARGDEADRVVGLELGADDYVAKPFSARELLARLRAVVRRVRPGLMDERLSAGGLVMDVPRRQVSLDGAEVEVTGLEFDLLAALIPGVGLEELRETPMGNADAIDAKMDPWLADKTKHEVVKLAQELRLPFTEVFTPEEILSDTHLEERGFLVDLRHPKAPPGMKQPGPAATMTATPWKSERAPLLGEHNDDILGGLLGLDTAAIEGLRASGVIS